MAQLLGIDIGTSSTKVVVIDDSGAVVARADASHKLSMPRPGWSEQDPAWWWNAVCKSVSEVLSYDTVTSIAGVGLSGQMHGSVFLPGDATPESPRVLRPAILWNDQRTKDACAAIEASLGGSESLISVTGNPALTGMTAPKILWLRQHEPNRYEALATLLLPKDYILFRLTGARATDVGDASGTLLFDPRERAWSDGVLNALEIDKAILPTVVESTTVVGRISAFASGATGLPEGTPVVIGSGDQMTGAVGAGVVREGIVSATLGTSGVVFAHVAANPTPDEHGRVQLMCAAVPGEYCMYGCMLSAAGALEWFRRSLAPDADFGALDEEASAVAPGSGGLLFLPYLTGERCPHADPDARGSYVGLTARHDRGHLVRALLEGVAMNMGAMLDLLQEAGVSAAEVRMLGGGARSSLWRAIHAGVFGVPVVTLRATDGSAYGAALLAGVGAGVWHDVVDATDRCIEIESRTAPHGQDIETYGRLRGCFDQVYRALRETTNTLGAFDVST